MAQTNNKRTYILLGILGVSILYLILSRTVFAKEDKVTLAKRDNAENISYAAPKKVSDNRKIVKKKINSINYVVKEFQFGGNWQNDPFFYLDEDSLRALRDKELGQYTDLKLSGISLLRDKEGYSIINSVIMTDTDTVMTASVLKEGDEFEGFRVVKIAFDHVILHRGKRNIRLELDEL